MEPFREINREFCQVLGSWSHVFYYGKPARRHLGTVMIMPLRTEKRSGTCPVNRFGGSILWHGWWNCVSGEGYEALWTSGPRAEGTVKPPRLDVIDSRASKRSRWGNLRYCSRPGSYYWTPSILFSFLHCFYFFYFLCRGFIKAENEARGLDLDRAHGIHSIYQPRNDLSRGGIMHSDSSYLIYSTF